MVALSSLTGGVRWPVCSARGLVTCMLVWAGVVVGFVRLEPLLLGGVTDFGAVETRLSFPRPLIPLLLFL